MSNLDQFEFREIYSDEAEQTVKMEQICFPPNEACTPKMMRDRVSAAPELFLVAVDKTTGKLVGMLTGLSTNEERFHDGFFSDMSLYDPKGKNNMLLGLEVLPKYQRRGIAGELVRRYALIEKTRGREKLILTCLEEKIPMYEKFGFTDNGIANSTFGGEEWHEMYYEIR